MHCACQRVPASFPWSALEVTPEEGVFEVRVRGQVPASGGPCYEGRPRAPHAQPGTRAALATKKGVSTSCVEGPTSQRRWPDTCDEMYELGRCTSRKRHVW